MINWHSRLLFKIITIIICRNFRLQFIKKDDTPWTLWITFGANLWTDHSWALGRLIWPSLGNGAKAQQLQGACSMPWLSLLGRSRLDPRRLQWSYPDTFSLSGQHVAQISSPFCDGPWRAIPIEKGTKAVTLRSEGNARSTALSL